jgi:hypothetical protein
MLDIGTGIFNEQRRDKKKIYCVHERDVKCISRGKARKRHEFDCKMALRPPAVADGRRRNGRLR